MSGDAVDQPRQGLWIPGSLAASLRAPRNDETGSPAYVVERPEMTRVTTSRVVDANLLTLCLLLSYSRGLLHVAKPPQDGTAVLRVACTHRD
jgi:hypothetical protein